MQYIAFTVDQLDTCVLHDRGTITYKNVNWWMTLTTNHFGTGNTMSSSLASISRLFVRSIITPTHPSHPVYLWYFVPDRSVTPNREVSTPYDYGYDYVYGLVRGNDVINYCVHVTSARLPNRQPIHFRVKFTLRTTTTCVSCTVSKKCRKYYLNLDWNWITYCNKSMAFHSIMFKE